MLTGCGVVSAFFQACVATLRLHSALIAHDAILVFALAPWSLCSTLFVLWLEILFRSCQQV